MKNIKAQRKLLYSCKKKCLMKGGMLRAKIMADKTFLCKCK